MTSANERSSSSPTLSVDTLTKVENPSDTKGLFRVQSGMITGLFILALFYTVYFTSALLIPVVLAVLVHLLLSPIVRWMKRRLKLPTGIAASLILLALLSGIAGAFYSLSDPAARWLQELPVALSDVKAKLDSLREPIASFQRGASQLQDLANNAAGTEGPAPTVVTVQGPDLTQMVLGGTLSFVAGLVIASVLLFFLLTSSDTLLRQAIIIIPKLRDKKRLVDMVREMEDEVSFYLLTISLINAGLGLTVGVAMYLLDMPNPVLWGAMAAVFNFVPLLGALTGVGVIALVAFLTFNSISAILLPPLVYLILTSIEAHVVTPSILAQRMSLNPVVVFLALILWTWLWGIAGALLAVPLLATFKICCDHIAPLKSTGALLGRM